MTHRTPIDVPDLGAGDEPIRFGQWLVDDDEVVLAGDRIAEVLTSGVLFSVSAPAEGTLRQGHIRSGQAVIVGESLGAIVTDRGDSSRE